MGGGGKTAEKESNCGGKKVWVLKARKGKRRDETRAACLNSTNLVTDCTGCKLVLHCTISFLFFFKLTSRPVRGPNECARTIKRPVRNGSLI